MVGVVFTVTLHSLSKKPTLITLYQGSEAAIIAAILEPYVDVAMFLGRIFAIGE